MTGGRKLDPEPWRATWETCSARGPECRMPWECDHNPVHDPRPVIFASRDPLRDLELFEGYVHFPTHEANPILVQLRQQTGRTGDPVAVVAQNILHALGNPKSVQMTTLGWTSEQVVHARAVLTRWLAVFS